MHRTSRVQTSSFISLSELTYKGNFRVITDMLDPHRKMARTQSRTSAEAPPTKEDDDSSPVIVLPSSTDMFLFFAGQSLEQRAKLSTGRALYDLSSMHKKWLRIYAGG